MADVGRWRDNSDARLVPVRRQDVSTNRVQGHFCGWMRLRPLADRSGSEGPSAGWRIALRRSSMPKSPDATQIYCRRMPELLCISENPTDSGTIEVCHYVRETGPATLTGQLAEDVAAVRRAIDIAAGRVPLKGQRTGTFSATSATWAAASKTSRPPNPPECSSAASSPTCRPWTRRSSPSNPRLPSQSIMTGPTALADLKAWREETFAPSS
ncbi:hypothetical protein QFZ79_003139 [Arthrobacter sp. V4I6]|nr:hypothetical protein [Arthrobacter sp. V1I7]MDQ0855028.1 hypothetical protein [Arthrobacter sp. V4I6]